MKSIQASAPAGFLAPGQHAGELDLAEAAVVELLTRSASPTAVGGEVRTSAAGSVAYETTNGVSAATAAGREARCIGLVPAVGDEGPRWRAGRASSRATCMGPIRRSGDRREHERETRR